MGSKRAMRVDVVPFWHFIVATIVVVVTLVISLIIGGVGKLLNKINFNNIPLLIIFLMMIIL